MKLINEKLAADLLEAGKKEFLSKGFQGASLRSIAASLGVTTGAIYRYYLDKEALFDALVEEPARILVERYRKIQQSFSSLPLERQLNELPEVSDDGQMWMIQHIYENFDAFKLIACSSFGTKYEHYIDTLIEIEVNASKVLIERMTAANLKVHPIDDELIHIVSSALFNGMFEPVRHNMPIEKASIYMDSLREFYSAGWFKILGISDH